MEKHPVGARHPLNIFSVALLFVAVSRGYDTRFAVKACDGLVFRLRSEIDQIHLSIEAQCGTACLPVGDCHTIYYLKISFVKDLDWAGSEFFLFHDLSLQTNATTADNIFVSGDSDGQSGTANIYEDWSGFSGHLIKRQN